MKRQLREWEDNLTTIHRRGLLSRLQKEEQEKQKQNRPSGSRNKQQQRQNKIKTWNLRPNQALKRQNLENREAFLLYNSSFATEKMQIKVNLIWNFTPTRKSKIKNPNTATTANAGEELGKRAAYSLLAGVNTDEDTGEMKAKVDLPHIPLDMYPKTSISYCWDPCSSMFPRLLLYSQQPGNGKCLCIHQLMNGWWKCVVFT